MMSIRRIFGLMLLFFFFEAVVAVVTTFVYPDVNVFLACVAMTGLALGVWAVFAIVTRVLMRPRTAQPAPAAKAVTPVASRPSFADDSFSQDLGALVTEANRRLAGSLPVNMRGELPSVSSLPLYLVIGGEGSGKTSAILNSGLEPRLLAGEAAREGTVVPTRLCNLWFAEGAVMADLSGRILVQESENWERAIRLFSQSSRIPRWKQIFLGRRSQSNLKGLVLVCDASQLARANDPQKMAAFARTLSDRLQAAASVLRREVPVYVLFTKCDGVQYFGEFFTHLSEPESRRLLGSTLPLLKMRNDSADIYAEREGKRLNEYFNRLYMSLAEKRLVFLAREEDAKKKASAYEFPRELKKLRGELVQFLLDVFRPNPLQHGPRLRGFYLSGQRWVARNVAPADASMASFTVMPKRADATIMFGSKQPGLPARSASSGAIAKWMFLTDLFRNVVLNDRAGYVAPTPNTREQEYRIFAFAGAGVLLLLLCLTWANSWRHNRDLLNEVQSRVESVHVSRADSSTYDESLTELDSLRGPLSTLLQYQRHGAPFSYRWGLYSGNDVTDPLSTLYFDRFRKLFLDPMLSSLTTQFLQLDPNQPVSDDVYSLLKAYRMVTSGECKPDAEFLGNSLLPIWAHALSVSPSDLGALAQQQTQFYISELLIRNPYDRPVSENAGAVSHAQEYLREFNGPDKILRALVEQINHEHQGDALGNYVSNYAEVLTGPSTIDAAYTRDGWNAMMDNIREHKLTSAGEPCVLGKHSSASDVTFNRENEREVQDLYTKTYIQRWQSFVAAHHVETFHNASDAALKIRILADNNRSPLLGLVYMAAHNTDLSSGTSTASQVITETKEKITQKITGLFGNSGATKETKEPNLLPSAVGSGANEVIHAFEPLRIVTDPSNREKWLNSNNQPYIQALDELSNSLATLPVVSDPKDPVNQQALDRAKKALEAAIAAHHALGATIPNTSSGVDVDLKALMLEPITYASALIKGVRAAPPPPDPNVPIRVHVNQSAQDLCSSVDSLRAKYPFNVSSTQEATIDDVGAVFAPGKGTLARFIQLPEFSKAYLQQGRAWVQNPAYQGTASPQFLTTLNNLSSFEDAVYGDGTGNPHFDYTLTLDGTGHVPFELDVDGHNITYNPKKGPVAVRLVWPPTTNAPTHMTIKAGQPINLQYSGIWGLFHLLQTADKQEGGLYVFSTIQLANGNKNPLQDNKGHPVTVQIRIESVAANAFGKGYFGKLRCENFAGWALR
jgi:type VI secretion system protein ImpL